MSSQLAQDFFATLSEEGLPVHKERSQRWKDFYAGPKPELAEGAVVVDIPQTVETGAKSASNVFTGSLGGMAHGRLSK